MKIGTVVLLVLWLPLSVRAELVPEPGITDARVRTARYSADEVYRIAGVVGYEIHIQFEAEERFVGLAAGDLDGIGFSTVENNLFLKPKAASVGTNLTVVTSRRRYQFDYTASVRRGGSTPKEQLFSLRFVYPQDPVKAREAEVEEILAAPSGRPRNLDYGYCGAPVLKPVSAFDDGVHTWLKFPGRGEWPAVFVQAEDGAESLANFTVQGDELVLHRIARRIILRRGRLMGCVVNRAFDGAADQMRSGTVSPEVSRSGANREKTRE